MAGPGRCVRYVKLPAQRESPPGYRGRTLSHRTCCGLADTVEARTP